MLLSIGVVGTGPAIAVDDPLLPGVPLSADVIDVTDADADLGTVAREEVAVMLEAADGLEIWSCGPTPGRRPSRWPRTSTAVRASSPRPTRCSIPRDPVVIGEAGTSGPGFTRAAAGGSTVQAVPPLSAETFGADQWGLWWVGAEPAWQVTRGEQVTVAVIDTGVDTTHTDLVGRTLPQLDLVPDGLTGDPQGHGTHVAGIIGASLDGSGAAGLANLVRILPVRVMNADGTGDSQTIATGIIAAVDAGAQVINMSIGSTTPSTIEENAVKYAVDHGVSVVASGGNGFEQGNPVNYPAASPGVLGVASVGERNEGASLEVAVLQHRRLHRPHRSRRADRLHHPRATSGHTRAARPWRRPSWRQARPSSGLPTRRSPRARATTPC